MLGPSAHVCSSHPPSASPSIARRGSSPPSQATRSPPSRATARHREKGSPRVGPDSAEFVVDERDVEDVKLEPKIEPDPRQLSARVAALAIRHPALSASTSSEEAQGPYIPEYRTQPLCRIPSGQLGPADAPRGRGRPKGSKSRPRIEAVHGLPFPPVRAASARARNSMTLSNRS